MNYPDGMNHAALDENDDDAREFEAMLAHEDRIARVRSLLRELGREGDEGYADGTLTSDEADVIGDACREYGIETATTLRHGAEAEAIRAWLMGRHDAFAEALKDAP